MTASAHFRRFGVVLIALALAMTVMVISADKADAKKLEVAVEACANGGRLNASFTVEGNNRKTVLRELEFSEDGENWVLIFVSPKEVEVGVPTNVDTTFNYVRFRVVKAKTLRPLTEWSEVFHGVLDPC